MSGNIAVVTLIFSKAEKILDNLAEKRLQLYKKVFYYIFIYKFRLAAIQAVSSFELIGWRASVEALRPFFMLIHKKDIL